MNSTSCVSHNFNSCSHRSGLTALEFLSMLPEDQYNPIAARPGVRLGRPICIDCHFVQFQVHDGTSTFSRSSLARLVMDSVKRLIL
jgi:hypothetical protein